MNVIPSSLARALPCSSVTALLSVQSNLLPMRILFTPSDACCSILECQVRISGVVVTENGILVKLREGSGHLYWTLTVERLLVRNIVNQQNAHGSTVVRCCNCPKPLLTGCVPLDVVNVSYGG